MCIVIDINALSSVLNPQHKKYAEFSPVLSWIIVGKGKIVYGGKKYNQELAKVHRYRKFFTELGKSGKIVMLDNDKVDTEQAKVENKLSHKEFNDPHIVAIVIVSKCCLVCTQDKKSLPFLKKSDFYPKGVSVPLIYTSSKNKDLLKDSNIVNICKPSTRGTQQLKDILSAGIELR